MTQPRFPEPEAAWDGRAEQFDGKHPALMDELVALCRRWRARGRDEWGVGAAFEVLRFERRIAGLPDEAEGFKLDNNFRAWYARELMRRYPDLEGIFRTRERRLYG